ncbi:MAG TPA: PEPxxWA-CTERM sorting domain-containing protein [Phenylobacterium sp.]|jgi:hypothetical protein
MKFLTTFASAAALAATFAVSAAPAHAAVFAQFTPDSNVRNFRWINSGSANSGTGGHFISMATAAPTTAENVKTHFTFLDPNLSLLAFIPALLKVDASVANGHIAAVNGAGVWTQTNLDGNFSFTYTGATIANFNHSGITLVHNSNLLSGVFTDAWIQGAGGSGSFNVTNVNGGHVTYTSAYETFSHLAPGTEEFAFNLLSATPAFGANLTTGPGPHVPKAALKSFRANGGGNFSFAPTPEPATWGLMIVGFGGMGLMLRQSRRLVRVKA